MRYFTVSFGLISTALVACNAPAPEASAPSEAPQQAAASARPALPTPRPANIAIVDGHAIPWAKFEQAEASAAKRSESLAKRALPGGETQKIVEDLITDALIEAQAEAWKIVPTAEEREAAWAENLKRFRGEEGLRRFLERSGQTEADVRQAFEARYLRDRVIAKVRSDVTVSEGDLIAAYERSPARFTVPARIHVRELLVATPPDAPEAVVEEKRAAAQALLKKVLAAGPARFAELAKKHGEGPAAESGGDLGLLARGRLPEEVEAVVWPLPVGKIAKDLAKSYRGFHILLKVAEEPERQRTLEEVRATLAPAVLAEKQREAERRAVTAWRASAKVEVFHPEWKDPVEAPVGEDAAECKTD